MNQLAPHIDHYLAEFARLERQLAGDKAISEHRQTSLREFANQGFPTPRQEDWKYTDLRPLEKRRFESADDAGQLSESELSALLPTDMACHRLVFVDGHFEPRLSDTNDLPPGLQIGNFASEPPQAGKIGAQINGYANALTNMNAAFMSDGLCLNVAANAVIEHPIYAVFVASGTHEDAMQQLRNFLQLGENSQVTLIEHHMSLGDAKYFTNAVTEVETQPGAKLTRIRLQQESEKAYHVSSLHAAQARDSHIVNYGVDLGARIARIDTNSHLGASGATIEMYGVYAASGKQHVDNHTRIDHAEPHGTSRENYKGVLSGKARGVFNGKIVVHKDAQKTDSEQSSAALLLSKKAEVDAKPELEIYADDVKCAHGSTVGQLDEDAVFYLTSRGIEQAAARAILTYSFADELLKNIEIDALRKHIEAAFLAKLPKGEQYAGLL